MKTLEKIILFSIALLTCIGIGSTLSRAATTTVGNEQELITAVNNATSGDTIELSDNILLTKPLEVNGKTLTIIGNGHTIGRIDTNWTPNGSNGTLITAGGDGTKLTLANTVLTSAQKYGVQSYNGAYVVLDSVSISSCGFGGVLVNAGTLEVKNLSLGKNGNPSNNGIEIAKGSGVVGDNKPVLIMNGTITSTENENVIYLAENDSLITFEVRNADSTTNKIFTQGNKVVVTDENNNVIYQSNENSNITVTGTEYTESTEPTTTPDPTEPTGTPTPEDNPSKDMPKEEKRNTTPKTGVENNIGVAITTLLISIAGIICLNRENRKN